MLKYSTMTMWLAVLSLLWVRACGVAMLPACKTYIGNPFNGGYFECDQAAFPQYCWLICPQGTYFMARRDLTCQSRTCTGSCRYECGTCTGVCPTDTSATNFARLALTGTVASGCGSCSGTLTTATFPCNGDPNAKYYTYAGTFSVTSSTCASGCPPTISESQLASSFYCAACFAPTHARASVATIIEGANIVSNVGTVASGPFKVRYTCKTGYYGGTLDSQCAVYDGSFDPPPSALLCNDCSLPAVSPFANVTHIVYSASNPSTLHLQCAAGMYGAAWSSTCVRTKTQSPWTPDPAIPPSCTACKVPSSVPENITIFKVDLSPRGHPVSFIAGCMTNKAVGSNTTLSCNPLNGQWDGAWPACMVPMPQIAEIVPLSSLSQQSCPFKTRVTAGAGLEFRGKNLTSSFITAVPELRFLVSGEVAMCRLVYVVNSSAFRCFVPWKLGVYTLHSMRLSSFLGRLNISDGFCVDSPEARSVQPVLLPPVTNLTIGLMWPTSFLGTVELSLDPNANVLDGGFAFFIGNQAVSRPLVCTPVPPMRATLATLDEWNQFFNCRAPFADNSLLGPLRINGTVSGISVLVSVPVQYVSPTLTGVYPVSNLQGGDWLYIALSPEFTPYSKAHFLNRGLAPPTGVEDVTRAWLTTQSGSSTSASCGMSDVMNECTQIEWVRRNGDTMDGPSNIVRCRVPDIDGCGWFIVAEISGMYNATTARGAAPCSAPASCAHLLESNVNVDGQILYAPIAYPPDSFAVASPLLQSNYSMPWGTRVAYAPPENMAFHAHSVAAGRFHQINTIHFIPAPGSLSTMVNLTVPRTALLGCANSSCSVSTPNSFNMNEATVTWLPTFAIIGANPLLSWNVTAAPLRLFGSPKLVAVVPDMAAAGTPIAISGSEFLDSVQVSVFKQACIQPVIHTSELVTCVLGPKWWTGDQSVELNVTTAIGSVAGLGLAYLPSVSASWNDTTTVLFLPQSVIGPETPGLMLRPPVIALSTGAGVQSCSVGIESISAMRATLLGTVRLDLNADPGLTIQVPFPDLGLRATFGDTISLSAVCTDRFGGEVPVLEALRAVAPVPNITATVISEAAQDVPGAVMSILDDVLLISVAIALPGDVRLLLPRIGHTPFNCTVIIMDLLNSTMSVLTTSSVTQNMANSSTFTLVYALSLDSAMAPFAAVAQLRAGCIWSPTGQYIPATFQAGAPSIYVRFIGPVTSAVSPGATDADLGSAPTYVCADTLTALSSWYFHNTTAGLCAPVGPMVVPHFVLPPSHHFSEMIVSVCPSVGSARSVPLSQPNVVIADDAYLRIDNSYLTRVTFNVTTDVAVHCWRVVLSAIPLDMLAPGSRYLLMMGFGTTFFGTSFRSYLPLFTVETHAISMHRSGFICVDCANADLTNLRGEGIPSFDVGDTLNIYTQLFMLSGISLPGSNRTFPNPMLERLSNRSVVGADVLPELLCTLSFNHTALISQTHAHINATLSDSHDNLMAAVYFRELRLGGKVAGQMITSTLECRTPTMSLTAALAFRVAWPRVSLWLSNVHPQATRLHLLYNTPYMVTAATSVKRVMRCVWKFVNCSMNPAATMLAPINLQLTPTTIAVQMMGDSTDTCAVQLECELEGWYVLSPAVDLEIPALAVEAINRWPAAVAANGRSSTAASRPLPPLYLRIVRRHDGLPLTDMSGVRCSVAIVTTATVIRTQPLLVGNRVHSVTVLHNGTQAVEVSGVGIVSDVRDISISVALTCNRRQGGAVESYITDIHLAATQLQWGVVPTVSVTSQEAMPPFSVSVSWTPVTFAVLAASRSAVAEVFPNALCIANAAAGGDDPDPGFIAQPSIERLTNNDTAIFHRLIVVGKLQSTFQLSVTCDADDFPLGMVTAGATIFGCPMGTFASIVHNRSVCDTCQEGYFSEGGQSECTRCPATGVACRAGRLTLLPGFYHPMLLRATVATSTNASFIITPDIVLQKCWNDEACTVDDADRSYKCARGYAGPLCGACDTSLGFGINDGRCRQCQSGTFGGIMLACWLVALIVISLLVYACMVGSAREGRYNGLTQISAIDQVALFLTGDFLQSITILRRFAAFEGSIVYSVSFYAAIMPTAPVEYGSVSCLLGTQRVASLLFLLLLPVAVFTTSYPIAQQCGRRRVALTDSIVAPTRKRARLGSVFNPSQVRLGAQGLSSQSVYESVMPTESCVDAMDSGGTLHPRLKKARLSSVLPAMSDTVKAGPSNPSGHSRWWHWPVVLSLLTVWLYFPSMAVHVFQTMKCGRRVENLHLLQADVNVECLSQRHAALIICAGLCVLLYGVLMSAVLATRVSTALNQACHGHFHLYDVFQHVRGMLAPIYRRRDDGTTLLYMEWVSLLRKCAFAAALAFFDDAFYQLSAALLALGFDMWLHERSMPFAKPASNLAHSAHLLTLMLFCIAGMVNLRDVLSVDHELRGRQPPSILFILLATIIAAVPVVTVAPVAIRRCPFVCSQRRAPGRLKRNGEPLTTMAVNASN